MDLMNGYAQPRHIYIQLASAIHAYLGSVMSTLLHALPYSTTLSKPSYFERGPMRDETLASRSRNALSPSYG